MDMLRHMTIRKKLFGIVLVMAVVSVLIAGVSIIGMQRVNREFSDFTETDFEANVRINNTQVLIGDISQEFFGMALNDETQNMRGYINNIDEKKAAIVENIQAFKDVYDGDPELLQQFDNDYSAWDDSFQKVYTHLKNGDKQAASRAIIADNTDKTNKLNDSIESLVTATRNSANTVIDESNNKFILMMISIGVLIVIGGVASVLLVKASIKSILIPLFEIEKASNEMARGNLQAVIKYKSRNEIGKLAQSMRDCMQILHNYILDIEHTMNELAEGNFNIHSSQMYLGEFENIQTSINEFILTMSGALSDITTASDQVLSGSEQVSDAAQSLAQGATVQSSSVEEISATMSNVSEQVKQNAFNANEASKKSNDSTTEIMSSNEQMKEMIQAMNDITEKSREIGSIVSTIDNIAFQTNILALNAAVEAARVGAAGKGFAVVAGEVRNLAVKSADAAKNTATLVEESIQSVEAGSKIANQASDSLKRTVTFANESTKLIDSIAVASNEQASAISQVNSGINQISTVVQTNSATSEETAAASEELSGQADTLKSIVSKYKLYEEEMEEE